MMDLILLMVEDYSSIAFVFHLEAAFCVVQLGFWFSFYGPGAMVNLLSLTFASMI